ncbi:MAG: hypothetical protein CMD28_02030 [Flavobacteriales bacterium]|jgi:hypothetical protein|nr:hypothetical protein [Flavobacteriales bacterium]
MRKIKTIAIILIASFSLNAQNQIVGKVLELSNDGKVTPIFGANVYWEETSVGTTTDIDGNYVINQAESFPATLSVSYVGYTFDSKEVLDGKYIFYLKSLVELEEVQIEGKQNTTKISIIEPLNIQTLSTGEIQKAACCNLSECFETNNTVDVSYSNAISGLKRIEMLGLDGNYIQITSELIPLIRGLQRSYGLNYIPGSWIESIQIIKGSGSVVNGYESLTGQINVEYFKPEEDVDKFKLNIYANNSGKLENNLILTKKKGDWRSNLFTHVSYFDREIDHHGGDNFIDMPKYTQFGFLNRWKYYGFEKYKFQINLRATIENRESGQITNNINLPDPYLVNIDNKILQLYTKLGKVIDSSKSVGSQTSFTLHDQAAKFGNNIYTGTQESFSFNIIVQDQLNQKNLIKYGSSYFADRFVESFNGNIENPFNLKKRVDLVTGLFSEYQYTNEKVNILSGIRADYYNVQDKIYYSPRINIKYNPSDRTAIRISSGKAFRVSSFLAENMQYLASSRQVIIGDNIKPEVGWNNGLNFSYCFYFLNQEGTLNIDLYRTVFENQIVVDIENKNELVFANLNGNSFANVMQIDLDYTVISNLNLRLSYKKNNSVSTFDDIDKQLPLQPEERALINLSYKTNSDKWDFDVTANYIGKSRIPDNIVTSDNFSSAFILLNSQVTYKWSNSDIYIGAENITNYTQSNPIIDPNNPFGQDFDASLIWGPVMGTNIYMGFRYNIN